jgi:protein arginine kinase activator
MTTVVGGDLKRVDLCEECARQAGTIDPSGFLAEEILQPTRSPRTSVETMVCPACAYPFESLQKTGRLGCAVCYEKFKETLEFALRESQKGVVHQGKRPARKKAPREEWEAEMRHLIAMEDFEGAARLRDHMAQSNPGRKKKTGSS